MRFREGVKGYITEQAGKRFCSKEAIALDLLMGLKELKEWNLYRLKQDTSSDVPNQHLGRALDNYLVSLGEVICFDLQEKF